MLFANVCAGLPVPEMGNSGIRIFLGFLASLRCLMCVGVPVLLVSLLYTRFGLLRCASCWTRP